MELVCLFQFCKSTGIKKDFQELSKKINEFKMTVTLEGDLDNLSDFESPNYYLVEDNSKEKLCNQKKFIFVPNIA